VRLNRKQRREARKVARHNRRVLWWRRRRAVVGHTVDLAGAGLVIAGVALFEPRIALIVAGVMVLWITTAIFHDGK
jgi:hypothetical protein